MSDDHTADLLKRAAVRLSKTYFVEVENERDSRWEGDMEEACSYRGEAEETRTLIEECRAAADRLLRDGGSSPLRSRARRSGSSVLASPPL